MSTHVFTEEVHLIGEGWALRHELISFTPARYETWLLFKGRPVRQVTGPTPDSNRQRILLWWDAYQN